MSDSFFKNVKSNVMALVPDLIVDFKDDQYNIYYLLAKRTACKTCDEMIVSFLLIHYLLSNINLLDKELRDKYSHLIYSDGRLTASESVGGLSVSYANKDNLESTSFGKQYLELCQALKRNTLAIRSI